MTRPVIEPRSPGPLANSLTIMPMDDINLSAKNKKELETLINTVRIYSQDIGIEFTSMCHASNEKRQTTPGG